MALKCVCIPMNDLILAGNQSQNSKKQKTDSPKNGQQSAQRLDLCKILERTQDERNKHNDYECHIKGENRQNLINKLKMYLDDYDDRPVMRRSKDESTANKALGQTGFGPLIKYPGYVDYEHPYFSDPYNKMPTLATTVGQHGQNPCPPISVRNWDETQHSMKLDVHEGKIGGHGGSALGLRSAKDDGRCHCAQRRGQEPTCPAAGLQQQRPQQQQWGQQKQQQQQWNQQQQPQQHWGQQQQQQQQWGQQQQLQQQWGQQQPQQQWGQQQPQQQWGQQQQPQQKWGQQQPQQQWGQQQQPQQKWGQQQPQQQWGQQQPQQQWGQQQPQQQWGQQQPQQWGQQPQVQLGQTGSHCTAKQPQPAQGAQPTGPMQYYCYALQEC